MWFLLYCWHKAAPRRPAIEGFSQGGFGSIAATYLNPIVWIDGLFESITFIWVMLFYYTFYSL